MLFIFRENAAKMFEECFMLLPHDNAKKMLAWCAKAYFRVNRYFFVSTGIKMNKIKDLENLFTALKKITQESGQVEKMRLSYEW